MAQHNELGEWGEERAAAYLREQGYTIKARKFRFEKLEIDIIAQKDDRMVCVEVKTRNSDFFGDPQSFVTPGKIKRLVKAMDHYLVSHNITLEARFDIIAILKNKKEEKITHLIDAFYHF